MELTYSMNLRKVDAGILFGYAPAVIANEWAASTRDHASLEPLPT